MTKYFRVQVSFTGSVTDTRPSVEGFLPWLQELGCKITRSNYQDTFFVECDLVSVEEISNFRGELDKCLLAITFRNTGMAVQITGEGSSEDSVMLMLPPSADHWENMQNLTKGEDFWEALRDIRAYYSISDVSAKVIYGCSLLDKFFEIETNYEELLSDTQFEDIKVSVRKTKGIDSATAEKLIKKIESSKPRKNKKNTDVANKILNGETVTEEQLKELEGKVKNLYKTRGKSAHKVGVDCKDVYEEAIRFLDSTFWGYLYKKFGFISLVLGTSENIPTVSEGTVTEDRL
jgi:hypothetical protein